MKKLVMYRPVASAYESQDFGENKACCKLDQYGVPVRPFIVRTKVDGVCPIGFTSFYETIGLLGHNGKDWPTFRGQPCYHSCEFDGWLRRENDFDGGIGADIVSNDPILEDENGVLQYVKFRTWHHQEVIGETRRQLKPGDVIALCDSTGASSGDHLHAWPKWCDKSGKAIKTDNGYQGSIPKQFIDYRDRFIGDVMKIQEVQLTLISQLRQLVFALQQLLSSR